MASTLELNKIAAAVLTAGVVAMGTGFVAEVLVEPEELEEPAYRVATAEPEGGEAPAEPAGPEPVLALLADASAAEGEKAVRACQACHSFDKGGPHKVGPNLYGVVGSGIAAAEGYSYSDALAGKDGAWTYDRLNAFLADPQGWAEGTKMTFAGVAKVGKRADIIAYLRQKHDEPPPLPSGEEIAAVEQEQQRKAAAEAAETGAEAEAEMEGPDLAGLLAEASAEDGRRGARACQACHSFDKGGPHKVGPNLYGVVGSGIAAAEGYSYSDALAGKDGTWTYDKLDAFLADPQGWAKGTKMTFAGVRKADKRADLIAFLRGHHDDPPPLPEGAEKPAEEAAAEAAEPAEGEQQTAAAGDLAARLAAGSAEAGKKAIAACKACHTFDEGGMARVGPNLYGVVGKDIAGAEDFDYSPALAGKDGTWTYAKLDAWIADPQGFAEGTKMTFPGVKAPGKRADIIAYLRRQHDDPPPLPGE